MDTQRQMAIIKENGDEGMIMVNQTVVDGASGETVIINDLSFGTYKATVTTGPNFSTQREEAANSMMDFIRVAPDTASFVIDLIAENQDWPGAVKIANRLRKLLPPGIDEEGPMQPPPPTPAEILEKLKAEGQELGNAKKKLDIIEQSNEMGGSTEQIMEAAARGALIGAGLLQPEEGSDDVEGG